MQLPEQTSLPLRTGETAAKLEVIDLFAGIGGMALGFRAAGFRVVGVDLERISADAFTLNKIGRHVQADLHDDLVVRDVPVVIGGPPCRPWSAINLQRRGRRHEDHRLLKRFFDHLEAIQPVAFLMENVPPLIRDPEYRHLCRQMELRGYSIARETVTYADFGAATTRRRLFTFGIRDSVRWSARVFFQHLGRKHAPPANVEDAIGWLRHMGRGDWPDHEWSRLRTIAKYEDRYETGKYGWKRLEWEKPAPSFGSVAKTYILHPDSNASGGPSRVISVREVLSIMGFERSFKLPTGAALSLKYRAASNAVSPIVSHACAVAIREVLTGEHQ